MKKLLIVIAILTATGNSNMLHGRELNIKEKEFSVEIFENDGRWWHDGYKSYFGDSIVGVYGYTPKNGIVVNPIVVDYVTEVGTNKKYYIHQINTPINDKYQPLITEVIFGDSIRTIYGFLRNSNITKLTIPPFCIIIHSDNLWSHALTDVYIKAKTAPSALGTIGSFIWFKIHIYKGSNGYDYKYGSWWDCWEADLIIEDMDELFPIAGIDEISSAAKQTIYAAEDGVIIRSDRNKTIQCVSIPGRCQTFSITEGENKISLPSGIYIIDGTKVAVN